MKRFSYDDFCQVVDLAPGSNKTQSCSRFDAYLSDGGYDLGASARAIVGVEGNFQFVEKYGR